MSLQFPPVPDIRLEKPPLAEVICQVRFPPLLSIISEDPAAFQERIRDQFPFMGLEHGFLVKLPGLGAAEQPVAEPKTRIYRFHTADQQITISLAVDFYAVSTTRYSHWHSFAEALSLAHEAVRQIYRPSYATRIGLRYINRFTQANTGCATVTEMFDLLRPKLTSHVRDEAWGEATEMSCRLVLNDEGAKLSLGTDLGHVDGRPVFVLDFDYCEEGRLEMEGLVERCSRYNTVIYRAFRWAVPDDTLAVFQPQEISV